MSDTRKSPRFAVNFGSTFAGEFLAGKGAITNLSVDGCSIESTITSGANSFGLEFPSLSEADTTRRQHMLHDLEQKPLVVMHRTTH